MRQHFTTDEGDDEEGRADGDGDRDGVRRSELLSLGLSSATKAARTCIHSNRLQLESHRFEAQRIQKKFILMHSRHRRPKQLLRQETIASEVVAGVGLGIGVVAGVGVEVCVRLNAANALFSALVEFKRPKRIAATGSGAGAGAGDCGRPSGKSSQVESIIFVVVPVYCLYAAFATLRPIFCPRRDRVFRLQYLK